jgi:protein-disulfide isomerase
MLNKGNSLKNLHLVLMASLLLLPIGALAQTPAAAPPSMPSLDPAAAAAAVHTDPFPPVNPKYFNAPSPTVETVNGFLRAIWGYDTNRLWRVEAIQSTGSPNVSKVVVFVTDKSPNAKVQSMSFFVLPDGKHAIADMNSVMAFGDKPFADTRAMLQARATGAWRGSDLKDLLLVEFADLQCPHCKESQATMTQIVKDFPKARVVFQPFPLTEIHASAFKAAAYGVCVQQKSNAAFFPYAQAVFDTQEALTPESTDATLAAAVTKAGQDPAAVAACAATPATKAVVDADIKLADDAGVDQTPMLSVNGHLLPIGQVPYETLKQIIVYQAGLDGAATGAAADILAPPPPKLTTLPK